MPRQKKLNIKVKYGGTTLCINDLGEQASPRFELYDTALKKVIKKSNNPLDFDEYVYDKLKPC